MERNDYARIDFVFQTDPWDKLDYYQPRLSWNSQRLNTGGTASGDLD